MTTWRLDRLSVDTVGPIVVMADGVLVTGWTYAVLPIGTRPDPDEAASISSEPVAMEEGFGVRVGPNTEHELAPGVYSIWVRYVDGPEAPVLPDVGRLIIT